MKKLCVKLLAALLAAVLMTTLTPVALMEDITAPVEAVDEAVPELDSVELDGDAELPVEDGSVSGDGYLAELPTFEESGGIPIDEAHFPDVILRGFASTWDSNGDGSLSDAESENAIEFSTHQGVTSLQGIEFFPNLVSLNISDNSGVTSLDVSKNTKLSFLACNNCGLTTLDVSNCPALVGIVDDANNENSGYSSGGIVLHYDTTKVTLTAGSKVIAPITAPSGGTPSTPSSDGPSAPTPTEAPLLDPVDENSIPIDAAHFPDPVLRNMFRNGSMELSGGVKKLYDQNLNGWLDSDEIAAIVGLDVVVGVTDLSGLGILTALNQIKFSEFTGSTIDLSAIPNLDECYIFSSSAATTVILPASLKYLMVDSAPQLTTVDASRCTRLLGIRMEDVDKIESMDFSRYPSLESVVCHGTSFKSVKLGSLPQLNSLTCLETSMTSLDITGCPKLLSVINDKYKKTYNAGDDGDYARVVYKHGDAYVSVSPTLKLITEKKSETVVPSADNTFTTTATSTKTTADVGQSYTISAPGFKVSGFKSSNKKVATVTKAGKVVPKKAGKVKITYKVNGKTRTVTLTVKDPTMPKSIKLDQSGTVAAKVGEKITLNATMNEGAKSAIKWTTSNKKIATVKGGVVTFKKKGKVTITATTKRGNKKAKVKFTVSK